MSEFIAGPTMVIQWITSGGTSSLAGDYRTCNWNPSIAYEDVTAGSDTNVGRLPTLKDATCAISLVQQTGGTALIAALQPGQAGTLVIMPEGTATNKRKITFPAYCDAPVTSHPYANVSLLSINFTGSSVLGAWTDSVNA
jgi:hypothetical protein